MATAFTIRAMGAVNTCNILWALLSFLVLCNAQSSVPIATQPVVSDVTLTSVIPSLQTIYSVITTSSTEAVPLSIATITTIVGGETTTIFSTVSGEANARPVVIQTITSTLVSTISVTTTQVVQSTVGFTTILGTVTPSNTDSPPLDSTTTAITDAASTLTGASDAVTSDFPLTTSYSTVDIFSVSSMASITGTAAVTSGSTPSPSVRASGGGLTPGSKAGIAIGVILGVTALVVAGFLLGQRYSRRRSAVRDYDQNSAVYEKDAFQAGRPYELTGSNRHPTEMSIGKMHPYSPTTAETTSGDGSVSAQSYEMPGSAVTPYSEPAELSALPQIEDKDPAPMYVGVPAHMSGSKRWSMKEYEKS